MARTDTTRTGSWSSDDHLADMCLTHRVGAHETRFGGGVEYAARQVECSKCKARITDKNQFSMGGNVHLLLDGFNSLGDELPLRHDQRT